MTRYSRRRFIDLLGLAAATPLAQGIGTSIVSRAMGAPATRRLGIFCCIGEGVPIGGIPSVGPRDRALGIVPIEVMDDTGDPDKVKNAGTLTNFTWPSILGPLEPFRSRMAIIDAVSQGHGVGNDHGSPFTILTAVPTIDKPTDPGHGSVPGGISIDQYAANTIGKDSLLPSLLFGVSGTGQDEVYSSTFAAGAKQPLSYANRPSVLYRQLVGPGSATMGPNDAILSKRLLDIMRVDIKRMETRLAGGDDRVQLDRYLDSIDHFDRKQQGLRTMLAQQGCAVPALDKEGTSLQRMLQMFQMASLALRCNLTNVVGTTIGNGWDHDDLHAFNDAGWGPYGGHSGDTIYWPFLNSVWRAKLGMLAGLMMDLGPLADQLVVAIVPANGSTTSGHHSRFDRTPVVVYDGTGTLKTGGRFVRNLPPRPDLADFFTSVTYALGAPVKQFNDAGKGPIPTLMA